MKQAGPSKVALIGGPDIDQRIDLMHILEHEFCVFAIGSEPTLCDQFAQADFRYRHYHLARGINPVVDLLGLTELLRIFRQERPNIVHTFDTKPGVWGRLSARWANVPIVIGTLPGLGSLYNHNTWNTRVVRAVYELLQRLACRLSDLTIFQNEDDRDQFVLQGVVRAHKTAVIPGSGVRTDVFNPPQVSQTERKQLLTELGIQHDETVVTMVSRLIRSKGVLEFATAAQIVRKYHPQKVRFLLVGPDDHKSIDRLDPAELAQLKQAVTWPGSRQDIPVVLAISDIFVLPSFYREGIPRVLLEAASMVLPIVTTDSPGCNEVVEDGVNGFLIPIRDADALAQAVGRLITDPEMRRRFGKESRQRAVTRFDLSVIAEQTRLVYWKLLAQKGLLPSGETS